MVIGQIQMYSDPRLEVSYPLELKARYFDHRNFVRTIHRVDQRHAQIATDEWIHAARGQHLAQQRRDGTLAVGPGDADDRAGQTTRRQFELADDRNLSRQSLLKQD